VIASSEYWTVDSPNDNHFDVALQSLTFANNGEIVGCGILVRNSSTSNVLSGRFVFHDTFTLPNNPHLPYPIKRLVRPIHVTGRFISAYPISAPSGYMIQETDFSLKTPTYNPTTMAEDTSGEFAFLVNAYELESSPAPDISVWNPMSFHHFDGTTLL
jgi:hypothetical protein